MIMRRCLIALFFSALLFCFGCDPVLVMPSAKLDKDKIVFSSEASTESVKCKNLSVYINGFYLSDSDWDMNWDDRRGEVVEEDEYGVVEMAYDWVTARMDDDYNCRVTVKENDTGEDRYVILSLMPGLDYGGARLKIKQKAK